MLLKRIFLNIYSRTLVKTKFSKIRNSFFLASGLVAIHAVSLAGTIVVNPGSTLWTNPTGENSGGGSSAITATMPNAGNGSLEMTGDRTRFVGLGDFYSSGSNLGLLSTVNELTFQWAIAAASTGALSPDYTPALRLHIFDFDVRSELVWEGAYNGTYGNTTKGQFYTSGVNDNFYRFVTGVGVTLSGPAQLNQSINSWITSTGLYSPFAYVSAISVGVGSSASSSYRAFADNVTFGIGEVSTTYNFETAAADVPEPATIALVGLGLLGFAVSRRRLARSKNV